MEKTTTGHQDWMVLVSLLKEIVKAKGLKYDQLAESTGLKESNISRVFSLKYAPTLKTFIAICKAAGVNFFFEDKESETDLNQCMERAMYALGRRVDNLPKN